MKKFEALLKSEIRKAEKIANDYYGRKDCKVTAYGWKQDENIPDFYNVKCEICFDYEVRADYDVIVNVFMPDRRRSFAQVKTW